MSTKVPPPAWWNRDDRWCVKLTVDEAMMCATVGALQQIRAIQAGDDRGRQEENSREPGQQWVDSILGQFYEKALCKAFDIDWAPSSKGNYRPDAPGIQVRGTTHPNGHLLFYRKDYPKWGGYPFVLVIGCWPYFKIAGWLTGTLCMRDEFWNDKCQTPCYWIPQNALMKMEELELIRKHEIL